MRHLLLIAVLAVAVFLPAGARAGGGSGAPPISLTSETASWNPNQTNRTCLSEDDYNRRVFFGSLNGSYTTSYRLCDLNTDGMTAGGIGLEAEVAGDAKGNPPAGFTDLSITAPDGTVHRAEKVTQVSFDCQGSGSHCKTIYSYAYAVCYVPLYFVSNDTGTDPLAGGSWQITLSGAISSITLTTRAQMTDVRFQQTYCPSDEQNLAP